MDTPALVAVVSDLHCGSTVGLCPPDPVPLDDGGLYQPTKAQQWLWQCWQEFWEVVHRIRQRTPLVVVVNGDIVDGDHHGTPQIISRHPGTQFDVAWRCLQPAVQGAAGVVIVRGTESHTGKSASTEEALARLLAAQGVPVIPDPATGTHSWWHFVGDLGPVRISATHHGRMGQRPWTKGSVASNLAAQIFYEHAARGERHPDVAVRSHYHKHADTGDAHPVRLIQTPAWQLATGYAYRVAPDSLADIGGVLLHIGQDGYQVSKLVYRPDPSPVWSLATHDGSRTAGRTGSGHPAGARRPGHHRGGNRASDRGE